MPIKKKKSDSLALYKPMTILKTLPLGFILLLLACTSIDTSSVVRGCPRIRFISDAAQIVELLPARNDPEGVVSTLRLDDFRGHCDYPEETRLSMDFDLRLIAEKGPAFTGDPITSNYFVALIAPDEQIIVSQRFDITMVLEQEQSQTHTEDHIELSLPLDSTSHGRDYLVILGFHLTPEQLAWNQNHRAELENPTQTDTQSP